MALPGQAGYVPTAAEIAQAQAVTAQAAATNSAWQNNTLPRLPTMGNSPPGANETTRVYIGGDANTQGQARDLTQAEYFQMFGRTPDQSEQQKHSYAFDPIDYGAMAGMTLSQIASRYGSGTADRVQDYYAAHPTAQAQAINNQYSAMHSGRYEVTTKGVQSSSAFVPTVAAGAGGFTGNAKTYAENWKPLSETLDAPNTRANQQGTFGIDFASIGGMDNPFNPDSAAGITWDVARGGGTVGKSVAAAALPEFQKKGISALPTSWISSGKERDVVPVSVLNTADWFKSPSSVSKISGIDAYFRVGTEGDQIKITDAKGVYAESGAFSLFKVVPNNIPGSSFKRIYPMLVAGGGDYALQGDALSGAPRVRDDKGKLTMAGVRDEYGNRMWATGSSEDWLYNQIKLNPSQYTKAGREFGGGAVMRNDNLFSIQSEFEKGNLIMPGRYAPDLKSYASLVTIEAENAGKGTIPGMQNLPNSIGLGFGAMPAWTKVDKNGNPIQGSSPISAAAASIMPPRPFLSTSSPAMPKPFISTSSPAVINPSGSPFGVLGKGLGTMTDIFSRVASSAEYIRANSPEGKTTDTTPTVAPMFAPYVSGAQNAATNMLKNAPAAASGWFGGAVETARKTAAWTPAGAMLVGTAQERTAAAARGERLNMWTDVLGVGMIGGVVKGKPLSETAKKALQLAEEAKFNPANIWGLEEAAKGYIPSAIKGRTSALQNAADDLFKTATGKLKAGVNIQEVKQTKGFVPSDIEATKRVRLTEPASENFPFEWVKDSYKKPADIAGAAITKKDTLIKGVLGAAGGWWASQQEPVKNLWNNTPTTLKGGVALVGSTAFAGEAGFGGLATSELGLGGMAMALESNPVGWGIGLGLAGAFALESQFGGLTKAKQAGGQAYDTAYRAGYGFAGGMKQGAQNMYNNSFLLRDRMDTAVKGVGVSMMSIGQGVYRGAETGFGRWNGNEAGTGTRVNKGELGIGGVFRGNEMGTGRFTGNEAGTGMARPFVSISRPANAQRDVYRDALGQEYPTRNPTGNPTKNPFGLPFGTGTPTGNPFKNPIDTPYKNPNKYPFGTPVGTPYVPTNIFKTPTGTGTGTPTVPEYGYDYPTNPNPPTTPRIKIPDLPLITLPGWPGGSESRGGGSGRSKGASREIIPIRSSLDFFGGVFGAAPRPKRVPSKVKKMLITVAPRRAAPRRAAPQKPKSKRGKR